ncbi:MAG: universal stress protein [Proteobacteria bacterium]|nr:universal stress protein [Pseudomonadota bacterium]
MSGRKKMKILLALDGSEHSLAMVRYAADVISPGNLEVVLFNAFNRIPATYWDIEANPLSRGALDRFGAWEAAEKSRMTGFMEKVRQVFVAAGVSEANVQIVIQDVIHGVARDIAAESWRGYDAVMIGRRGTSRIRGLLMGGVASKLMSKMTNLPLGLVVGKVKNRGALIAFDGSAGSDRAVDFYARLMRGADQELTLLHVVRGVDMPNLQQFPDGTLSEPADVWIQDHLRSVKPRLEQARDRLIASGFDPGKIGIHTITGVRSRAETIVEQAQQGDCGTIVVGRRGISEVFEHAMGRVSDKVVHLTRKQNVWVVN